MKNYTVTVNGNIYNVSVEENGSISSLKQESVSSPMPKLSQSEIKIASGGGNIKVEAPMAGKILDIKTKVGASVKKGEVLLILEAMKMENEIVAPGDAVVASVDVSVGDSVEISQILATLN